MIAGAVAVFVEGQGERLLVYITNFDTSGGGNGLSASTELLGIFQDISPFLSGANPANNQLLLFQTPDHVHIDHRHGVRKRHDGMIDVIVRSNQAFLFTAERDKDNRAPRL